MCIARCAGSLSDRYILTRLYIFYLTGISFVPVYLTSLVYLTQRACVTFPVYLIFPQYLLPVHSLRVYLESASRCLMFADSSALVGLSFAVCRVLHFFIFFC